MRQRWTVLAAAAVVTAAVALPVLLTRGGEPPIAAAPAPQDLGSESAPAPSITPDTVPSSAPSSLAPRIAEPGAGKRAVTFHGLTVDVPEDWPTNDYQCGPRSDTVLLPGPIDGCGPPPQTVTTVQFQAIANSSSSPTPGLQMKRSTLDGTIAEFGSGVIKQQDSQGSTPAPPLSVESVAVPELDALVIVKGPDADTVSRLAESIRVTDVDAAGCVTLAEDTFRLPASVAAVRPGADRAVIPGAPSALSICRYVEGRLEQSAVLTGADITDLQKKLAAAPEGTWEVPTENYLPEICRDLDTPDGQNEFDYSADGEGYRIVARYPSGPEITAIARLSVCGELGVSNGSHTVQPSSAVVDTIIDTAGNSSGLIGPMPG